MGYEDRERMGGLCAEKKTCSRDPSWLQIARCMYHMDFNVVKQFFFLQDNWHPVDKPRAVPYSEPTPSERAVFYDAAQAAGPVYLHGTALTIQFESRHPVLHH